MNENMQNTLAVLAKLTVENAKLVQRVTELEAVCNEWLEESEQIAIKRDQFALNFHVSERRILQLETALISVIAQPDNPTIWLGIVRGCFPDVGETTQSNTR